GGVARLRGGADQPGQEPEMRLRCGRVVEGAWERERGGDPPQAVPLTPDSVGRWPWRGEVCPEVLEHAARSRFGAERETGGEWCVGLEHGLDEVEGAGREHFGAGRGFVVRHLGGEVRAVEVRDLGEDEGSGWRGGCGRVDLDAAAAESRAGGEPGALEQPGRRRGATDDPGALVLSTVVAAVLGADQSGFGAAEVAPACRPCERPV